MIFPMFSLPLKKKRKLADRRKTPMWSPEILAVQMKIGGFVLVNELLNT